MVPSTSLGNAHLVAVTSSSAAIAMSTKVYLVPFFLILLKEDYINGIICECTNYGLSLYRLCLGGYGGALGLALFTPGAFAHS